MAPMLKTKMAEVPGSGLFVGEGPAGRFLGQGFAKWRGPFLFKKGVDKQVIRRRQPPIPRGVLWPKDPCTRGPKHSVASSDCPRTHSTSTKRDSLPFQPQTATTRSTYQWHSTCARLASRLSQRLVGDACAWENPQKRDPTASFLKTHPSGASDCT